MFSKPVGVSTRPSKDYPRVRGISDATSTLMLSPFAAIKRRDREPNLNGGVASGTSRAAWRSNATIFHRSSTTRRAGAATFYTTRTEHSPTSATGTGWERTPWHATQRAAWEALKRG